MGNANIINVTLPVVTTQMNRVEDEAAFIHDSPVLTIFSYSASLVSSNIATGSITTNIPHNLSVGDLVLLTGNTINPGTMGFGGINGIFKIYAVSSNQMVQIKIPTVLPLSSSLSFNINPGQLQSFNAPVDTSFPGPYIFDPVNGVSISNISTTTNSITYQNTSTKFLSVTSTSGWDANGGYIAIGFGTSLYDRPIKYNGILNTTTLIIDTNYVFLQTIPSGTNVSMMFQKAPWVPPNVTTVGAFWATDDSAGVLGCIDAINQSVASGVNVNYNIKYPSDVGLGGQGYPTKGSGKESSVVAVYGLEGVVK